MLSDRIEELCWKYNAKLGLYDELCIAVKELEAENARLHGKIMDANTIASVALQEKAELETESERLIDDRQVMADALSTITDRAEELRAENNRLREALQEAGE